MRPYEKYIDDISKLTGLSYSSARYLSKLINMLVGHEIYECMVDNNDKYEARVLGVGKLRVETTPDGDDYWVRFVLSRDMKKVLDNVMNTQKSPLDNAVNETIIKKLIDTFKVVLDYDDNE